MYPQVNGKKSNFFVQVCTKPKLSYHFRSTLLSSTMEISTFEQPIFTYPCESIIKEHFTNIRMYMLWNYAKVIEFAGIIIKKL